MSSNINKKMVTKYDIRCRYLNKTAFKDERLYYRVFVVTYNHCIILQKIKAKTILHKEIGKMSIDKGNSVNNSVRQLVGDSLWESIRDSGVYTGNLAYYSIFYPLRNLLHYSVGYSVLFSVKKKRK